MAAPSDSTANMLRDIGTCKILGHVGASWPLRWPCGQPQPPFPESTGPEESQCTSCAKNTFNPVAGQSTCGPCPEPGYAHFEGATYCM